MLLPPVGGKRSSSKEKVLKDQPELLRRFGIDIVPMLVEVCFFPFVLVVSL